jgi:NAD(P)H-dependent flavin oxidoreductase YrpB (nitropropane dioxygenase family)
MVNETTGGSGGCRYDPLVAVRGTRRFSQAISEGDGISVIVDVQDLGGARSAEEQGAEGIVLRGVLGGIRDATELPILWLGDGPPAEAADAGADAFVVRAEDELAAELHGQALGLGLDCVIRVANEEELEEVLNRLDPEIFLLAADGEDDEWEHTFDLLSSVPAGKLAIAAVLAPSREQVVELERAGVDAVIVGARDVAGLVGGAPPQV